MDDRKRAGSATTFPRRPRPRFAGRVRRNASWPCPHPSVFSILVVHEHHDVVIQLSGALDLAGRDPLAACVASALADEPRRLVLELSGLDFVDVVGAACFAVARTAADEAGVELVVDAPTPFVRRVLDLCDAVEESRIRST
jgi:anti-sigma B factor antagonist